MRTTSLSTTPSQAGRLLCLAIATGRDDCCRHRAQPSHVCRHFCPSVDDLISAVLTRVRYSVVCLLVDENISLGLFDWRQRAVVGAEFFQSSKVGALVHAKVVAGPFRRPPVTQPPGAPARATTKLYLVVVASVIVPFMYVYRRVDKF